MPDDEHRRDDREGRFGGRMRSSERDRSPRAHRRRSPDAGSELLHRQPTEADSDLRHSRHRSPDHGRDHSRRSRDDSTRPRKPAEDLIPRFREKQARTHQPDDNVRRRSRSRERGASASSVKRHRSRSHSQDRQRKKKRHSSPSRRDRDRSRDRDRDVSSRRHRRHSPHERRKRSPRPDMSPRRRDDESRSSRRRRESRSPHDREPRRDRDRDRDRDRERERDKDRDRDSRRSQLDESRRSSRSVERASHSSSARRAQSPTRDRLPAGSATLPLKPPPEVERATSQPRDLPASPRGDRDWRPSRDLPDPNLPPRPDFGGPDAPFRGSYRGGSGTSYSSKPQYHNEYRSYSPQRSGSFHKSPTHSPYGRPSRGDHQPSSQQQAPYHHSSSSHNTPGGSSAHYQTGPSHDSYGSYRGRGGRGAFNGGPNRGSNFKAWNSSRGPHDDEQASREADMADSVREELAHPPPEDAPRGPSGRAPPTGPSNKFSFAFKPSLKSASAAPKPPPEISQKFNANPQRRLSLEKAPAVSPSSDRAPPPSAPRGPAAGGRQDHRPPPPEGPRTAPRMRKVKKIQRRPKTRPQLDEDLVNSESVFFRKPGNESVVGSGTYGKVFKGLNVYTKGQVALKRIRMEGERDGFPVTAIREVKLLQSLRHTNIVNLEEVMVERNDCFMVFEYLSHDLTGLLNHPTFKLNDAQKKDLAKQLFDGLDYLHARGVLHRDIKAANILVSNEGVLKLADFGLARFYAKHHNLDYTNRVITIWYRSPELLLGETKYTAAVDVWSAACVMVEIFTKHAIFPGDGTELSQLIKIYDIMGTPNLMEWPNLVNMAWFELLKPTHKKKNVFADKYQHRVTPAAFDLLSWMFRFDPAKRPTASEVLQHPYFATEEPLPKQAVELADIDGDWHEFESKALRKENERKDREARKNKEKERKRQLANPDSGSKDAKKASAAGENKGGDSGATVEVNGQGS